MRSAPGRFVLCAAVLTAFGPAACAPARAPEPGSDAAFAAELDALSLGITAGHEGTFLSILSDAIATDDYVCRPSPRQVLFGDPPEGTRTIAGKMPHYGLFSGPMRYVVHRGRPAPGAPPRWDVTVTLAVELPPDGGAIELPDCELARDLSGGDLASIGATCTGTPYSASASIDACARSGVFTLPATRAVMIALLGRWSREAERYWNRDAAAFGLPVRYDFELVPDDAIEPGRADLAVRFSTTCGRTPYFVSFRSGWSLPIVAHEIGHVLGLLDEYEALSGITRLYPKTPFPGAEVSRMGLSMREDTRLLPLHHYLILRRYFCPEPRPRGFDMRP